jgi:serine/threonine protein kinase
MKPDNILFRSRATLGSKKYFYCVISDFGIACEDRDSNDPKVDTYHKGRTKLGTSTYFAPELCYSPYSIEKPDLKPPKLEFVVFPANFRHSSKSDLWALGAAMYNLCVPEPTFSGAYVVFSHLDFKSKPKDVPSETWMSGQEARHVEYNIPPPYTDDLRQAIRLATTYLPDQRPDPITMLGSLRELVKQSGFEKFGSNLEPLPDWATRVHEYFGKAEMEALGMQRKAAEAADKGIVAK